MSYESKAICFTYYKGHISHNDDTLQKRGNVMCAVILVLT